MMILNPIPRMSVLRFICVLFLLLQLPSEATAGILNLSLVRVEEFEPKGNFPGNELDKSRGGLLWTAKEFEARKLTVLVLRTDKAFINIFKNSGAVHQIFVLGKCIGEMRANKDSHVFRFLDKVMVFSDWFSNSRNYRPVSEGYLYIPIFSNFYDYEVETKKGNYIWMNSELARRNICAKIIGTNTLPMYVTQSVNITVFSSFNYFEY